jgi:hypothetical protein
MDEENLDKYCMEIVDDNINMTVPWYLIASFAYYNQDNPVLSDGVFDKLGRKMLAAWDKIEHHHKELITEDDLKAGTFLGEYPSRVESAVNHVRESCLGKQKRR